MEKAKKENESKSKSKSKKKSKSKSKKEKAFTDAVEAQESKQCIDVLQRKERIDDRKEELCL